MKQVIINRGSVSIEDLPAPALERGQVLVEVAYSVISSGTELSKVESSGKSILQRVVEQPQRVQQVVDLIKARGIRRTFAKINETINLRSASGYSCSGRVVEVANDVTFFSVGDEVACAGAGIANHAEIVCVPKNLVVKVPPGCNLADASSVTLGAIAIQGVRRSEPELGNYVAVIGLGLIGQITVQLLNAAGCQVIGIDTDARRVATAQALGMWCGLAADSADVGNTLRDRTMGHGVDATLITAASRSHEIVQQAMEITRKKGKVVLVGDVGLHLKRSPFYEKELDFAISCSYGPGRYDASYEQHGIDYPLPYVRWTENRNMSEYLRLISARKVDVTSLIEREYSIDKADEAFNELQSDECKPLAIRLKYSQEILESDYPEKLNRTQTIAKLPANKKVRIAVIGAGEFARGTHLPNLKSLSHIFELHTIVSRTGISATDTAEQFGALHAGTDFEAVLDDSSVDAVLIGTRHHLHAAQVVQAILAGKHVYCEKPLALTDEELEQIVECYGTSVDAIGYDFVPSSGPMLTVGFNRRFAPTMQAIQRSLQTRSGPLLATYRVNALSLPNQHWTHGPEGGGRIRGEACHMFDTFDFLVGSEPCEASVQYMQSQNENEQNGDNASITVRYRDGSVCHLLYAANGHASTPKEYLEVFSSGRSYHLRDFKSIEVHGDHVACQKSSTAQKGHLEAIQSFGNAISSGTWPISLGSLVTTTRLTNAVSKQL